MTKISSADKAVALKHLASLAVSTGVVRPDKRAIAISLKVVHDTISAEEIASSPELANASCEVSSLLHSETLRLHDRIRASLLASNVPEDVVEVIVAAL